MWEDKILLFSHPWTCKNSLPFGTSVATDKNPAENPKKTRQYRRAWDGGSQTLQHDMTCEVRKPFHPPKNWFPITPFSVAGW